MQKFLAFLRKNPILIAVLALLVSVAGVQCLDADGEFGEGVLRALLCGTMAFFLALISGDRTLKQCGVQTGYVIRVCLGFWIFSFLVGILGWIAPLFTGEAPVYPDWPLRLLTLFFTMFFAGLFEELCFRAVLNDAIIYQFRNFKGVFALSAVVSFLVFGYIHVYREPFTDAASTFQIIMKTLNSGIFGLGLLILYWKTRNIWACGIVHGVYDFLVTASQVVFDTGSGIFGGSYVASGAAGTAGMVMSVFTMIITLLIVLGIWKKAGKTLDFDELRATW